LVEDDPDVADVVCAMLREADFRCSIAHGAEDASTLLAKGDIDVIVTDVLLRGRVSGLDIAERGRILGIASVLVTGDGITMERLDTMPHRWLRKPFKSQELIEAVRDAVSIAHQARDRPSAPSRR
jgi:DNA-binding response OmpR family regulator